MKIIKTQIFDWDNWNHPTNMRRYYFALIEKEGEELFFSAETDGITNPHITEDAFIELLNKKSPTFL